MPFALGVYLPLSLSSATMVGGIVAAYANRHSRSKEAKEKGILISSGLVGGDACTGIIIAVLAVLGVISTKDTGLLPPYFTLIMYALIAVGLGFFTSLKRRSK